MKTAFASLIECAAVFAVALVLSAITAFGSTNEAAVEFPEETEALVEATLAFFKVIEGNPKTETKSPVIRMPGLAPIKSAVSDAGSTTLRQHGPVRHLTGYRINWYPVDRFLGAVDFMGTWNGNRNLVCGYLVWDLTSPKEPVLNTVTANFIDLDDFKGKSPSDVHQQLLEANCAFGAIDDNYAFFEPGS